MEKQKLIELLRDAYLTGVKEKTFADQMNWLDYDYEAMGGAYAGAVVNNGVLDDVINSFCPDCGERGYKTNLTQDSYACKNCLAQWAE